MAKRARSMLSRVYMHEGEVRRQLAECGRDREALEVEIDRLKVLIKEIEEREHLISEHCQHVDNGGFMMGFCKICGTCLG